MVHNNIESSQQLEEKKVNIKQTESQQLEEESQYKALSQQLEALSQQLEWKSINCFASLFIEVFNSWPSTWEGRASFRYFHAIYLCSGPDLDML